MNIFLYTGNTVHLAAFFVLIFDIIKKRDCSGISGKTQVLLAGVFLTRYTDLLTNFVSFYNEAMKIIFISLSLLTVYLIYFRYRKSYDKENDTFYDVYLVIGVTILAAFVSCNYEYRMNLTDFLQEFLWEFSLFLEAVAILPQYHMTKKTEDGTRIMPYVVFLCVYRSIYIMNWIYRYYAENRVDYISSISGVVQTIILFVMIIDIQKIKERRPKWYEITEVFTIEAAKLGQNKEISKPDEAKGLLP